MPQISKKYGKSPSYYAWQRLKKNRNAFMSLIFIFICLIIALGGYLFLPDSSPDANKQNLELELLPPLSKVTILQIPKKENQPKTNIFSFLVSGKKDQYDEVAIKNYKTDKDSLRITPYDCEKEETYPINNAKIVNRTYWLGTDRYGRDMLSRLLLGTRISFAVGLISVIISLLIGVTLGAMAGFFRGWADHFILWLMNVVWAIPTFLLVMAVSLVLGKGFWQVFVAVGLTMWVEVARLVRGQILSARELDYVTAAKALGFGSSRIISRHILPNIFGPVLVIASANFASAILLEAGLSFLGLGVQPPAPSWGVMINDHYGYIVLNAAYLAILPGLAIMFLVLAFNLLGNGLRDALDVKMR
jgi:peptide/nickel transport system permease protein